jgi:hypothetical protein
LITIVVALLAYGCPIQAIVHAYGLDERTVASWRDRAGAHCQSVHHALVETGSLDLQHVQADEIRVKGRSLIAWMGLAIMVSTRLWVAGIVSPTRDRHLADRLLQQVRACAQVGCALLVSTDGWNAYPKSIQRAFREKVKRMAGPGKACLVIWPALCIATVIKHTKKKRVVEVTRKMTRGSLEVAERLLQACRRRKCPQYGFHRALQWDDAGTLGHFNAQMSPCRTACGGPRKGDVCDWLHLQLLLAPS